MVINTRYLSPIAKADAEYKTFKKKKNTYRDADTSMYKRGNISNISVRQFNPVQQTNLGQKTSDGTRITLDSLIDDFLSIVEMDGEHLPTIVHLGKLYLQQENVPLAEYWLERGMKRAKGRGCGGGTYGIYGGYTSTWSYEGWKGLAQVMQKTERFSRQVECDEFAKKFEMFAKSRGFECLGR